MCVPYCDNVLYVYHRGVFDIIVEIVNSKRRSLMLTDSPLISRSLRCSITHACGDRGLILLMTVQTGTIKCAIVRNVHWTYDSSYERDLI